jgi:zinc/manganese transport system permease protein
MVLTITEVGSTGLSWNLVDDVRQVFAFHFMVNAFRAGTIVAVIAAAMGWFMVLRRQTFAGHTLAVVAFPGAAGATLLGLSATAGYFVMPIAAAIVVAMVPRSGTGTTYSAESAVVGTVQAFALAAGALFVSLYGGFLNGLTSILFGTFLGISDGQVLTLLLVALGTLLTLAVCARPLFFATVDPDVARARGVPVRAVSFVFLVLLACAAGEVSQVTGVLLVFALLVMPAATAQRLTARPALSLALTIAIALCVTWLGLAIGYFSPYPVGFWITTFGFAVYSLTVGGRAIATRLSRRPLSRVAVAR